MSLFFSHYIPPNSTHLDYRFSQAGSNFIFKLMITQPEMKFSHVKIIGLSREKYDSIEKTNEKGTYLKNILCWRENKLFFLLNTVFSTLVIIKKIYDSRCKNIWFYNLLTFDMQFSAFLSQKILGKKVFVLLADYDSSLKFRAKIQTWILKRVSGILSLRKLSPNIKCQNNYIIHGITNIGSKIVYDTRNMNNNCLFAGLLDKKLGIDLVLDTFKNLPEFTLYITGKGPEEELVHHYAQKYRNIHFLGFLDYAQYLQHLKKVTFCLSLRNPSYENNKYEFPSKILEFLENGKLILTNTYYENLPSEYVKVCEFDSFSLKDALLNLKEDQNIIKNPINLENHFGSKIWKEVISKMENYQII